MRSVILALALVGCAAPIESSSERGHRARVLDVATGRSIADWELPAQPWSFALSGRELACGFHDGEYAAYELPD